MTTPAPRAIPRLLVLALLAACGTARLPESPPASVPPPPASVPRVVSPARWLYRHVEELRPEASHPLPGDGAIHGGDSGERWITLDPPASDGGAPRIETAPFLLPDGIAGILPVDGRWAFFGKHGRVFFARTPLGPIDEVKHPPSPVRSMSAGKGVALAVTMAGDLLRSTDGSRWTPAPVRGLVPAVPIDVALRTDGSGLLLAAPQRMLYTKDAGATWARLPTPDGGPFSLRLSAEGDVQLLADGRPRHQLTPAPPGLTPVTAPYHDDEPWKAWERGAERALSGKQVVAVSAADKESHWVVETSALDREDAFRPFPALDGCLDVGVATGGGDFVLGCSRRVGGDGGAPAPEPPQYRLVLLRSKDGGATWAADGEAPLLEWKVRIVAGPDGWLLVQRDCPSYEPQGCRSAIFRAAAGAPFADLPATPEVTYLRFAVDVAGRRVIALGTGGSPSAARFESWTLAGGAHRSTALPAPAMLQGTVTVDDRGAVIVAAEVAVPVRGHEDDWVARLFRSTDDGATFQAEPLPEAVTTRSVAFSGSRGIALDAQGDYWETASSARTWVRVAGRRTRAEPICEEAGCVIGTERRLGWDLPSEASPPPIAAPPVSREPVPGGPPLRCAAGAPATIARALLDDPDELALAAARGGDRLAIPAISKDEGVDLLELTEDALRLTPRAIPLFGAPPKRSSVGSSTEVTLSQAGTLASRATFPVDASRKRYPDAPGDRDGDLGGWSTPVSVELAWRRPADAKVHRARLPPLGKLPIGHRFSLDGRQFTGVHEILPDGVVWSFSDDNRRGQPIFRAGDDGKGEKVAESLPFAVHDAVRASRGLALLQLTMWRTGSATVFGFAGERGAPSPIWRLAPPSSSSSAQPLVRGDEAALVVAWPGLEDRPSPGFLIPLRPGSDPPEVTDLGLAPLLVERPPVCDAARESDGAVRIRVELPRAARRPVLVEGAGEPALWLAEAVIVVVPSQGGPCVSHWMAHHAGGPDLAVVPLSASRGGWALSLADADDRGDTWSRALTVRALRCEEAPGLAIPASLGWKGFSP